MDLLEANAVYNHPKGHSRAELTECLDVLHRTSTLVEVSAIQYAAMADALSRLDHLNQMLVKVGD